MSIRQAGGDTELHEGFFERPICDSDPAVDAALRSELARQQDQIELIASENIVSRAVLEAAGSVLTNKYAEGYPGRRYYGGCEFVDVAEDLAIERAKTLFGCAFANVQAHSGAQANAAVYFALCKPGDTILGLSLAAGGHLTHGAAPNLSGKWFDAVQYGVREDDGRIDMEEVARLAREHRPENHRRRRLRLSENHRFRRIPRDSRRGRCLPVRRHGPLRGTRRGRRSSQPLAPCPRRRDDDPQDPARTPRGHGC